MKQETYLGHVRQRLAPHGYQDIPVPADLAENLPLAIARTEPWGRLVIALARLDLTNPTEQETLVKVVAAWARNTVAHRDSPACQIILVFPFTRHVEDEISARIKALRQGAPDLRWAVVPWSADLEVELVDRHSGSPKVGNEVALALTEVPRGATEELIRRATGPKIGVRSRIIGDWGAFPVTRTVMATTIAYFLWVILSSGAVPNLLGSPSRYALVTWGALHGDLIMGQGQNWRLLTYMLLHGSIIHLGINMWSLWSIGRHMEMIYGSRRTLFIYIVAGVVGGMASTVLRPYSVLSVGASGAIFGLVAADVYAARVLSRRTIGWLQLLQPLGYYVVLGFFLPILDNYAHAGGFVGGLAAAYMVGMPGERTRGRKVAIIITSIVVLLVVSGLIPLPYLYR